LIMKSYPSAERATSRIKQQYQQQVLSTSWTLGMSQRRTETIDIHALPDLLGLSRSPASRKITITLYRLLFTLVVVGLGGWKAAASYKSQTIILNTLDLIIGVVLTITFYWLGVCETSELSGLEWLFLKQIVQTRF